MEGPPKPPSRSPEVEAFHRYYHDLLDEVYRPVELARSLFTEGVISSEPKDAITSDKDVEGKRALMDAVERALVHASNREAMFQSLVRALQKVGYYNLCRWMTTFVDGEHINTMWFKSISCGMCMWV